MRTVRGGDGHLIFGMGILAIGLDPTGDGTFNWTEGFAPMALAWGGNPVTQGEVFFADAPFADLAGKMNVGRQIERCEQEPAGVAVNAVDQAHLIAFATTPHMPRLQTIKNRAGKLPTSLVSKLTCRLVDHCEVVVLKQLFQRRRGLAAGDGRKRHRQHHAHARGHDRGRIS